MAAPKPRSVTPIIAWLRDTLGQRKIKNHLRFEQTVSPRSVPAPALPAGTSNFLANNYYYTRDGRREANPATVAFDESGPAALASGETSGEKAVSAMPNLPRPGLGYDWTSGKPHYSR